MRCKLWRSCPFSYDQCRFHCSASHESTKDISKRPSGREASKLQLYVGTACYAMTEREDDSDRMKPAKTIPTSFKGLLVSGFRVSHQSHERCSDKDSIIVILLFESLSDAFLPAVGRINVTIDHALLRFARWRQSHHLILTEPGQTSELVLVPSPRSHRKDAHSEGTCAAELEKQVRQHLEARDGRVQSALSSKHRIKALAIRNRQAEVESNSKIASQSGENVVRLRYRLKGLLASCASVT